jgi:hypothetical protein
MQDALLDFDEEIYREAVRRQTWVEEEKERRRRILADVKLDFHEAILSEIDRQETRALEEEERKRRVREGDDEIDPTTAAAHELVQDQFMGVVHRKEAAAAEEEERARRINAEFDEEKIHSEINRRVTWYHLPPPHTHTHAHTAHTTHHTHTPLL